MSENKKTLQDLANMVTVRNHLYWLIQNAPKNLLKKQDVPKVLNLVNSLDVEFINSSLEVADQNKIDSTEDLDVQKAVADAKAKLKAEMASKVKTIEDTTSSESKPKKGSFKRSSQDVTEK